MDTTWGQVMTVTPLTVRLCGDTTDTPIGLTASVPFRVGDKVALVKIGADWWAAGVIQSEVDAAHNLHLGAVFDVSTSGTTLLTAGAATLTFGAGRRIRAVLHFDCGAYGSTVDDVFNIGVQIAATVSATPVQVMGANKYLPPGSYTYQFVNATAGAVAVAATAQRVAGTGTMQFRGKLIVDDVGPS